VKDVVKECLNRYARRVVSKSQLKERPFGAAVGLGVQKLRTEAGLTQDELARKVREAGGDWDQAAIARLEGGHRGVSPEQMLILASALEVQLRQLIGGRDQDWIRLSPTARLRTRAIRDAYAGHAVGTMPAADFDDPTTRSVGKALAERQELVRRVTTVWPEATRSQAHAAVEAVGDAERKAARRLGVDPVALSAAAHRTWGRSFVAERDAGAAEFERAAGTARRSLQAVRGHVTRMLLAELAPILEQEADQ
jgi:transcriptional regulator with XRE-family HTH domain